MGRLRWTTVTALLLLTASCTTATARTKAAPVVAPPAHRSVAPTTSPTTTGATQPFLRQASDFHRPFVGPRPLRIMVVGDSVGITLANGLQTWANESGGAEVRNDARAWCSLGRYLPRNVFGPQNSTAGCDDWGTRWAEDVRAFDPDVVFVMYTVWEVIPRRLPGASDFTRPGDPALDAWQLSEYRQAADVLSARGARVVFFSIACENNVPIGRGEPFWYVNRGTLPLLAASRPSVRLIDLDALLCGGGRMRDDLGGVADIRPDHAHYSDAGALALARWLMPIILGRVPAPPYALS
jgi:hypothetical protein